MEFLILGIVSALNFIFILHKFQKNRIEDAVLDSLLFIGVVFLFNGTYAGMVVGMVASLLVSIYLYFNPPNLVKSWFKNW